MHQFLRLLDIATIWYNSELCFDPRIFCYNSRWLSASQFAPPSVEVLAETKTTIFYIAVSASFTD